MKFGIFFEMSTPRPFTADVEASVYRNALEQARLADELGFDWVWAVEHHFLEEYSHCSAPEVVLAAVAAQTERIRVGHGAVVCVPEMNHPIRVAERCAALDIISGGRLEVGTARSSTWTELGGFNVDPDDTKKTWDEFVRALPKLWADGHASWEGSAFSMPERNVLPKPVQKPHPPMWVTVTSPGTECDAADRGLGCLGVAAAGYEEQERRTAEYFRRIEQCDPVGGGRDPRGHHVELPLLSRGSRRPRPPSGWAWSAASDSRTHICSGRARPTRRVRTSRSATSPRGRRATVVGRTRRCLWHPRRYLRR